MSISVICPLCRAPLLRDAVTWRCGAGHAFDVAREGYVNLLPVQNKKSRAPGDSPDMVNARREFLDAGHYAPLRDALAAMLAPLTATRVVDIGCGEGYYTTALATSSSANDEIIGIDIARDAVQRAARRYSSVATHAVTTSHATATPDAQQPDAARPKMTWLVASSASLPIANASCDLAVSLFAPVPAAEIARVLQARGHLLIVAPAADHLRALREALFEDVRAHEPEKILASLDADFQLCEQREVRFPLPLSNAALKQLLVMTPYAWRAKRERSEALAASESFSTEAAFTLFLLEKTR